MLRTTVGVLVLIGLSGCRSATPVTPVPSPAPTAAAVAPAVPTPDSIKWVRDSAEYRAAVMQAYRMATAHVEMEARARQQGTWAVILDADETIINNSVYQLERARQGLGYSPDSWNQWVRRREATPIPGAGAFLARVRALGGRIAIVTNRLQSECADTAAVLERHTLVYDALLCRQDGTPSDKNPRFEAVATGRSTAGSSPLDVIAFVGDNVQDFPRLGQGVKDQGETGLALFGERYFVIPNPMYGSWQ